MTTNNKLIKGIKLEPIIISSNKKLSKYYSCKSDNYVLVTQIIISTGSYKLYISFSQTFFFGNYCGQLLDFRRVRLPAFELRDLSYKIVNIITSLSGLCLILVNSSYILFYKPRMKYNPIYAFASFVDNSSKTFLFQLQLAPLYLTEFGPIKLVLP